MTLEKADDFIHRTNRPVPSTNQPVIVIPPEVEANKRFIVASTCEIFAHSTDTRFSSGRTKTFFCEQSVLQNMHSYQYADSNQYPDDLTYLEEDLFF